MKTKKLLVQSKQTPEMPRETNKKELIQFLKAVSRMQNKPILNLVSKNEVPVQEKTAISTDFDYLT